MIAARMDRLPSSKGLWRFIILLSLGCFFETYELFSTSFVLPGITRSGLLANTTQDFFDIGGAAAYIAATFIGMFIGTFAFGSLADRFGRRATFTYALLGYSICALIMACQSSAIGLCFWRLMTGIGLGIQLVTIDAYLGELVPPHIRGKAFAINHAIIYLAGPVCGIAALLLVPHTPYGIDGWRWVIGLGSSGSLLIWTLRRNLPESPRWLASKGRLEQADQLVSEMERRAVADTGRELPTPEVSTFTPLEHPGRFSEIWQGRYTRRTIMLVTFHFFLSIGVYGFINWIPTFLIEQGVTVAHSLVYSVFMGCAAPLAPLIASTFADRIERKWQIVTAAGIMACAGLLFAFVRHPALVIACGTIITVGSTVISMNFHAYQSELYPTRIRAMAVGLVYSASRISGMLSGFLIAFMLGHYGLPSALALIAGSMVVVALVIGILGPHTRGRSLESLND